MEILQNELCTMQTAKEGAQTSIHLAVAKEVASTTGEYFSDCQVSI